jgi:hypothetical protein
MSLPPSSSTAAADSWNEKKAPPERSKIIVKFENIFNELNLLTSLPSATKVFQVTVPPSAEDIWNRAPEEKLENLDKVLLLQYL